jgi:hypothetical protein
MRRGLGSLAPLASLMMRSPVLLSPTVETTRSAGGVGPADREQEHECSHED